MADYNPVTYLLDALRSLVAKGWQSGPLAGGLTATAGLPGS